MSIVNTEQQDFWSSPTGQLWVTHQEVQDTLLAGALDAVVAEAAPHPGETILDIGCGTGASGLVLSDMTGMQGHVTGLDISEPLLQLAKARAQERPNLDYILGDAQTYDFPNGVADLVISRFGVMFFENPVAAFANLRRATRQGGRLAMICWQAAPANPWFMVPMRAATERLGKPTPKDPYEPGPMAFKDIDRVTDILAQSGWTQTQGRNVQVDLIPPQSPKGAAELATTLGPATRVMREYDGNDTDLAAIRAATADAFAQYQTQAGLRIPAGLILYTAVNSS